MTDYSPPEQAVTTPARTYIEERRYYPTGADPDDWNAHPFAIGVFWRGAGKWMVSPSREGHRQLSCAGNWLWMPLKMTAMRWCRFDFETACRLAEANVDHYKVNGKTWGEWEQHFAERREASA